MNKTLLVLLGLGLLVLGVIGGSLLLWKTDGTTTASSSAGPGSAAPGTSAPELESRATSPDGDGPRAVGRAGIDAPAHAAHLEWDLESSRWVEGAVELPAGTPADERLEVLALNSVHSPFRIARWAASGSGQLDEAVLSREEVAADGSFRLPFPPDADEGWIVLLGNYLFHEEAVAVDLSRGSASAAIRPRLGAWIRGRVVLPEDTTTQAAEVAGFEVELAPDRFRAIQTMDFAALRGMETEVDGNGAFEFRAVPSGIRYTGRIQPDELAAAESVGFEPGPGEALDVEIHVTRGATVRGWIRDEQGEPIGDVEVSARRGVNLMGGDPGRELREASSADDGAFELRAVQAGRTELMAESEGYLQESTSIDLSDLQVHEGVEIVLQSGSKVAGTVLWPDGTPAVGAEVRLQFDMGHLGGMEGLNALRGAEGRTTTDAGGAFSIAGLGNGPFTVRASAHRSPVDPAAGAAPAAAADVDPDATSEEDEDEEEPDEIEYQARADDVQPDTLDLELRLEEPLGLRGVVVDDLDQPVGAFRIEALSKTGGLIPGLGADRVSGGFEHEQGEFFLSGLQPGDWEIYALSEGHGLPAPVEVRLPQSEGEVLQLVVVRAATVHGTVVDTGGAPVADARVTLQFSMANLTELTRFDDRRPDARTEGDGSFELGGVTAGTASLVANAEGFATSAPVAVDVGPGESTGDVLLTLREGGTLTGEVFGSGGDFAVGVTVMAQIPGTTLVPTTTVTEEGGFFEIDHLAPGNWQVIAMLNTAPDAPPSEGDDMSAFLDGMKFTMAEILEGEETHVVLGAPPEDPVRVTGQVQHAGAPAGKVMISFMAEGGKGMEAIKLDSTDEDGRYEVMLDKPGDYLVTVQKVGALGAQNSVESPYTIPEKEDHKLDVDLPVGRISGRVTGPDGPISGARVSLVPAGPMRSGTMLGGHYSEVQTDSDGRYEIDWLREGSYTLASGGPILGGMFGTESAFGRKVRDAVQVREGQWLRDMDFELSGGADISGRVVDSQGKPVSEAAIFVRDEAGLPLERFSFISTDGAGRFTYRGVTPGSYTVSARKRGDASHETGPVHVREDEKADVELVLEQGATLIVILTDREGIPIEASITVTDPQGRQVNGILSLEAMMRAFQGEGGFSSTEQRVGPLPPGRYKVEAVTADGRRSEKPVTLQAGAERRLKIRLRD